MGVVYYAHTAPQRGEWAEQMKQYRAEHAAEHGDDHAAEHGEDHAAGQGDEAETHDETAEGHAEHTEPAE